MQKDLIETRHLNKTAQECDKALSAIVRSSQAETFVYLMTNSKLYLQDSGNQCLANIFFFFSPFTADSSCLTRFHKDVTAHTHTHRVIAAHYRLISFVFLDKYPQKKKSSFFSSSISYHLLRPPSLLIFTQVWLWNPILFYRHSKSIIGRSI